MTGGMVVIGPCFSCQNPFMFDVDRVQSIPIDPETGTPPDMGGDPARAVRQPICPTCCRTANVERRQQGLPLWDETDTAQPPR